MIISQATERDGISQSVIMIISHGGGATPAHIGIDQRITPVKQSRLLTFVLYYVNIN